VRDHHVRDLDDLPRVPRAVDESRFPGGWRVPEGVTQGALAFRCKHNRSGPEARPDRGLDGLIAREWGKWGGGIEGCMRHERHKRGSLLVKSSVGSFDEPRK